MSEAINNASQRQELLKRMIQELHAGKTVEEVKAAFASLLQDVGAGEVAAMEQALIAEGMPEEEIKRLCDVHVAVFRESLDTQARPETTPGHPVFTFRAENLAAGRIIDLLEAAVAAGEWAEARAQLAKLREYDCHFLRKENLLFPYLEQHGFKGPSSVMWAIHDDIRKLWKALAALLEGTPDAAAVAQVKEQLPALLTALRDMAYKEEKILFPAALERLTEEEWAAIRAQEEEIGYCYVRPGLQWRPMAPESEPRAPAAAQPMAEGLLPLEVGAMTLAEINRVFGHLPIDVTFVDTEDAVRFFSQGKDRIFPRSPAIIGRKVQNCHPPASLHRVQQILDDFRAGLRDEAEFWIQMQGKFIHIRYFALRDEAGAYQGTLEVTQDVTHIRALEGERRLLDE